MLFRPVNINSFVSAASKDIPLSAALKKSISRRRTQICGQYRHYISGSSSKAWLDRQRNDRYVAAAKELNYRARSAFKLKEIDDKFKILKPNQLVIDLGAAPGSWSQLSAQRVLASRSIAEQINKTIYAEQDISELAANGAIRLHKESGGLVIGVDLLDIVAVTGCVFFPDCDLTQSAVQNRLREVIDAVSRYSGPYADVIMSDMAPNASGIGEADHINIIKLVLNALQFSENFLAPDGAFICKVWQGEYVPKLYERLKLQFKQVHRIKPDASRAESSEIFLIGTGFRRTAA